jgi:hypothetical protein
MPPKAKVNSLKWRAAQQAKFKAAHMELKAIIPYLMADLDSETKAVQVETIRDACDKLMDVARWWETDGKEIIDKGAPGGNPIANLPQRFGGPARQGGAKAAGERERKHGSEG